MRTVSIVIPKNYHHSPYWKPSISPFFLIFYSIPPHFIRYTFFSAFSVTVHVRLQFSRPTHLILK